MSLIDKFIKRKYGTSDTTDSGLTNNTIPTNHGELHQPVNVLSPLPAPPEKITKQLNNILQDFFAQNKLEEIPALDDTRIETFIESNYEPFFAYWAAINKGKDSSQYASYVKLMSTSPLWEYFCWAAKEYPAEVQLIIDNYVEDALGALKTPQPTSEGSDTTETFSAAPAPPSNEELLEQAQAVELVRQICRKNLEAQASLVQEVECIIKLCDTLGISDTDVKELGYLKRSVDE